MSMDSFSLFLSTDSHTILTDWPGFHTGRVNLFLQIDMSTWSEPAGLPLKEHVLTLATFQGRRASGFKKTNKQKNKNARVFLRAA